VNAARDFRAFILRGSVVDLAVGIVIGAAFGAVVTALVKDLITPLITIPGKVDFSSLSFTVGGGTFRYGEFINAVLAFLLIALVVFFFVVRPVNRLMQIGKRPEEKTTRECPFCLTEISKKATRCSSCTSTVEAVA